MTQLPMPWRITPAACPLVAGCIAALCIGRLIDGRVPLDTVPDDVRRWLAGWSSGRPVAARGVTRWLAARVRAELRTRLQPGVAARLAHVEARRTVAALVERRAKSTTVQR
jgi:hypothetical protein